MLSEKQILEIREHLERAQNPVFFYDNDADGLCSYVTLRRYVNRGKGVSVRSHPDIDEGYAKKSQELNADYIFVLDRPVLGEKFVEEIRKIGLPIVWIDHHDSSDEILEGGKNVFNYDELYIYNPQNGKKKSSEPVSYWAYKISDKKEDMWFALMGCIADHYLPEFAEEFKKQLPEYWGKNIKEPFEAYYKTELGRLARVVGFALKDSITHVVQLQNFLINCKAPGDLFLEIEGNKPFARKYKEIEKKYSSLLNKVRKNVKPGKVIFFNYGGDMSMSSDIANELSFWYSNKVIVVAYTSGPITNISMRGENARKILEGAIKDLKNASGGGHEEAVGARIQSKDLEIFENKIYEEAGKEK